VSGKDEQGRYCAPAGPEILDIAEGQMFDCKAHRSKAFGKQCLAARIIGRDRWLDNQLFCKV
jgi:hypothetical protein